MRDKPGIHAMYGLETVGVSPVFVSPTYSHYGGSLTMSCLQIEVLLETIYEEVLEELSSKNFHLLFSKSEIDEMAEKLTLERFWDR